MCSGSGPSLALFALVASVPLCLCSLSIDESLLPKDHNTIVIDNNQDAPAFDHPFTHRIHKRDVIAQANITAKVERLYDSHPQLLVHWTGKQSNVFICLARNNWDHLQPNRRPTPSAIYISFDSGTTYKNKTTLFTLDDNTTYASIDKFYNHPRSQNYMVFVDQYNKMLYTSKDYGETVKKIKPNFQPIEILSYPEDPNIFLVHDVNKTLWITRDFGESFNMAQEFVKQYAWAERWPGTLTDTPTRSLLVQRIEPYSTNQGSTLIALGNLVISDEPNITVEMRNIEEFIKFGDFVFVVKKVTPYHKDLYISYRGGDFYKAVFGTEYNNTNYHIADVSEIRIMVAVAHNETLSNLYISEVVPGSNYMFRLSLERIFCFFPEKMWKSSWLNDVTEEKFTDLHKVKGMRGIYLASQVTRLAESATLNPEHLRTLITYDWGGEWKTITPPTHDEIGRPFPGCANSSCSLHLTQKFMSLYPYAKTAPILTSASAPGLIVATGVLGTSLKGPTGVFVSRDAGLTWSKVLREDYLFNFGDHGGIMTAVKFFRGNQNTQDLLYSTDEGESWSNFTFINDSIRVYNLMTQPGENTTTFTLFGSEAKIHGWIIITIDLRGAFKYNCTKEDYKPWSPSGGLRERKTKSICIMGLQEVYERRTQHSNCYNGRDYERSIRKEPCTCDIEDFECDFGFVRHVASSGCVRNKSVHLDPYRIPDTCKPGAFYNRTKGYRKIDGDACYGGYDWQYLPELIPCPFNETSHFLLLSLKNSILRFNLANPYPKPENLPIAGMSNVIAFDFDMKQNCLFYADVQLHIIFRQCLSGNASAEVLVENGIKSVEGLAYDWISKMLYFVDGHTVKIEVIRTDIDHSNRMRKTILDHKVLEKPRGIALHPAAGYMFWTDWSALNPHVGRANLNGSDWRYLFSKDTVHWPNGITVDHIAEQIYWVDAKLDYIAAADLHGRNLRKIVRGGKDKQNVHPFSVAVFKDFVYWDDWETKVISIADKDLGNNVHVFSQPYENVMDLKIYAHSMQEGTNACANSSTICSHLCFAQPDKKPPVCACPDDMIMKDGECRCHDGSVPFKNHTCKKVKEKCEKDYFLCKDNVSCIPNAWKCNGINDCSDGSDEVDCKTCRMDQYRCRNGHCIPKYWVCDGDPDCQEGEDELSCPDKVCLKDQFQCKEDKKCISMRWRCDGESDCKDNSDELNCNKNITANKTCTEKQFRCDDGQMCIPKSWVCDGVRDCKDHSDEPKTCSSSQECDPKKFQCKISKICIFDAWRCDGDFDCGEHDKSDEENCPETPAPTEKPAFAFVPCKEFMFKCADNRCIPDWWKCDNVADCVDGSDELGCPKPTEEPEIHSPSATPATFKCADNEFMCESGECIPSSWLCDHHSDCSDGSDEVNCTKPFECPSGYLKCLYTSSCYHSSKSCDGQINCPDGSDERDCRNRASFSPNDQCMVGFFKCPEGNCLPLSKKCNLHDDCIPSGADEVDCEHFERVYQVEHINPDLRSQFSPNSLSVIWSVDNPTGTRLEYMPSISLVSSGGKAPVWKNHTAWTRNDYFTFQNLLPYTQYNITVYVREQGKSRVFPPSTYVVYRTHEDVPSPPLNVTVVQKSNFIAEVSWNKPARSNGVITEYQVYSHPPLPPMKTTVLPDESSPFQRTNISILYEPGTEFSYWVVAVNSAGSSNDSAIAKLVSEQANIGPVTNIEYNCVKTQCQLSWKAAEGATGYKIRVYSPQPYPKIAPVVLYNATSYNLTNLSPRVRYTITITPFRKTFEGQQKVTRLLVDGAELPVVQDITANIINEMNGYSVKVTWKAPMSTDYNEKWTYGVYYGTRASELFEGARLNTTELRATVDKLQACETYLFDVGLVGPLGLGPLSSNPARITTPYYKNAPPKGLTLKADPANDTIMVISWNSSCFEMKEPIGYTINLEEMMTGQKSTVTLLPNNATSFEHRISVDYGARYRVSVQTSVGPSVAVGPVEYWAPLLPIPHQVRVEHNNSVYIVHWKVQPTVQHMPNHEFEILVSEGDKMDENSAMRYKAKYPPYIISDIHPATPYSIAVRLVSETGYRSQLSEVNSVQLLPPEFSTRMSGSKGMSAASVFLTVFVAVLVVSLVAVGVVYAIKQNRLRNSFASFANSHYSTSSGAAIFTDRLDDEDSPVIRGFSDDEPLVVA